VIGVLFICDATFLQWLSSHTTDFILCVNRKPIYSPRNYPLEMRISLFDRTASGRSFFGFDSAPVQPVYPVGFRTQKFTNFLVCDIFFIWKP